MSRGKSGGSFEQCGSVITARPINIAGMAPSQESPFLSRRTMLYPPRLSEKDHKTRLSETVDKTQLSEELTKHSAQN